MNGNDKIYSLHQIIEAHEDAFDIKLIPRNSQHQHMKFDTK